MEKFYQSMPVAFFITLFHRVTKRGGGSTFIWHIVLCCTLLIAVVLGIFAWFTYGWATREPEASPASKSGKAILSIDELRGVITLYQKKESDHNTLLHSQPEAPLLGVGGAVQISPPARN